MIREPHFDGRSLAVRQDIDDPMPLEVADGRSVAMPALPGPIIDPNHPRVGRTRRTVPHDPQRGVLARRQEEPPRQALSRSAAQGETKMSHDT